MEIPTIKGEARKASGSRAAARLRRTGKVPAIVYGHKQDPAPVTLDAHDMEQHLAHGAHLLNVQMTGQTQACLIRDAQYDHLGLKLVHIDLARVDLNEKVKVHVAVELRGTPKGIGEGGVLRQDMQEMEVECLVTNIPKNVRIDISDMGLNSVLYVKDLKLEAGLRCTNEPDSVVATVRLPQVQAETPAVAAPVEGSTEPEVIAKGKIEEEGEEATAAPTKEKK